MEVSYTRGAAHAAVVRYCHVATARGFTYLELMTTLAVAAILVSIAAPSFTNLIHSNRITTHINHLVSQLNYARSEAVKRNERIEICKSNNGENCTGQNDWSQGYIIFADLDRDRHHEGIEPLLSQQQALNDDISISYSAFPSSNYVIFYPDGRSLGNGTFTFCDAKGSTQAKAAILYKTGHIRTSRNKAGGGPLNCPSG